MSATQPPAVEGWLEQGVFARFDQPVLEIFLDNLFEGRAGVSTRLHLAQIARLDIGPDTTLFSSGGLALSWTRHDGHTFVLSAVHPQCRPFAEALVTAVATARGDLR